MPAANRPPSCGADSIAAAAGLSAPPVSLLLLFRFADGSGGASPGTGGAPAAGAAPAPALLSTMGADLSLVWTDFNLLPLPISDSNAPCPELSA